MHARQRFLMDEIRRWTLYCGKFTHSSCKAISSSCRVRGCTGRFLILVSKASHICSMGLRSGLLDGQVRGCTLWSSRCWVVILAVWGLAPSCINIVLGTALRNGSTYGSIIWVMYWSAVKFPWTTWRGVLELKVMPPHILSLPPGRCLSLSSMHGSR